MDTSSPPSTSPSSQCGRGRVHLWDCLESDTLRHRQMIEDLPRGPILGMRLLPVSPKVPNAPLCPWLRCAPWSMQFSAAWTSLWYIPLSVSTRPGSGKSPGEGNGYPLWYSCLGNPMDRGAQWATIHGVTKESDVTHFQVLSPLCRSRAFPQGALSPHTWDS